MTTRIVLKFGLVADIDDDESDRALVPPTHTDACRCPRCVTARANAHRGGVGDLPLAHAEGR